MPNILEDLSLLLFRELDVELLQLGKEDVPVVLPRRQYSLVLQVCQHGVEIEGLLALLDDRLP